MTKNAAAKKAARAHARAAGTSYTTARRLTREDAPNGSPTVWVTYEFTGPDAPASFQLDATWWLDELGWAHVANLTENGWAYDPSGPEGAHSVPELLTRIADQHPQLEAAASWVAANTFSRYEEVTVPDQYAPTGETTSAEYVTTYPYRMTFDPAAAKRWFDARGPHHHLTLSDFVTPSERRTWLDLHWPGSFDCSAGRHHFDGHPSPYMGECTGCGAMMLGKHNYNGDEYEAVVDEDEYFAEAAATQAACNWAPPTLMLYGETQSAWHERNRSPLPWA